MSNRKTRKTTIRWGKNDYTWHSTNAGRTTKLNVIVELCGYANKDKLICELIDNKFAEVMANIKK